MLVISKEEQKSLINMQEIISLVEKALVAFSSGETQTPIRTALPFNNEENTALFMPSIAENLNSLGIKVVNVVPGNKPLNKHTINGLVLLSDMKTGEPAALLEGSYITKVRTGALSGVATKYLAREDARVLGIIGSGEQAKGVCEAILTVREIDEIYVYNRTKNKAELFASYFMENFGMKVEILSNANEVVEHADIIVTATNAHEPVYSTALKKGVHINAVGSFRPDMQEIPSSTILSAEKVVVESKDAALEETGDLKKPINEGFPEKSIFELGEIINSIRKGRTNDQEITVFKSVGLAIVDIVVGQYIFERAVESGIGLEIHL
ncbi:ornithine cyclodeaminase family protein [Virgibacillus necropolis]|uniref:Delta(1)-pyrroline-2-carboxylate reductase n=1 Tax=Virgibacillus necropolis TaxID=163877 RepID=A0A221MA73_9BACI|nr:ornithine cyclodeaminase family protein [Virgibacillus necropolis]ASN04545.1 ornithine cyclodeaminase [Virgibacillus necropolis]